MNGTMNDKVKNKILYAGQKIFQHFFKGTSDYVLPNITRNSYTYILISFVLLNVHRPLHVT
jgi:hypothetical protein